MMNSSSNQQVSLSQGSMGYGSGGMSVLAVMDSLRRTGMKLWNDAVKQNADATLAGSLAAKGAAASTIAQGASDAQLSRLSCISSAVGAAGSMVGMVTTAISLKQTKTAVNQGLGAAKMEHAGKAEVPRPPGSTGPGAANLAAMRELGSKNFKEFADIGTRVEAKAEALRVGAELRTESKGSFDKAGDTRALGEMFSRVTESTGRSVESGLSIATKMEKARHEANSQLLSQITQSANSIAHVAEATASASQKMADVGTDSLVQIMSALNMKG